MKDLIYVHHLIDQSLKGDRDVINFLKTINFVKFDIVVSGALHLFRFLEWKQSNMNIVNFMVQGVHVRNLSLSTIILESSSSIVSLEQDFFK